MTRSETTKVGVFVVLLAWCASGCGSASSDGGAAADAGLAGPRVLVGEVSNSDARVAVVARGTHARVYFCGGDASYQSFTRWLNVAADHAGRVVVEPDASMDFRLDAKLSQAALRGTVDDGDGAEHDFAAQAVAPHTIAGLYEATSDCGKVGLIVTQASADAQPAGQGACIPDNTDPIQQVNPLMPLARAKNGAIEVRLAGANEAISVKPAAPP